MPPVDTRLLSVTVWSRQNVTRTFRNVCAVGVGHLEQDLVLVFPANGDEKPRAEEIGRDWTSVTVHRPRHVRRPTPVALQSIPRPAPAPPQILCACPVPQPRESRFSAREIVNVCQKCGCVVPQKGSPCESSS
jgi:hypothetical protein